MSVAQTHRAGTTGTMLLMHLQGRDSGSALQEARLVDKDGTDDYEDDDDDDGVYDKLSRER